MHGTISCLVWKGRELKRARELSFLSFASLSSALTDSSPPFPSVTLGAIWVCEAHPSFAAVVVVDAALSLPHPTLAVVVLLLLLLVVASS